MEEILNASRWYEDQQVGLGDRFTNTILRTASAVLENPLTGTLRGTFHEKPVQIFPYLLIYKINSSVFFLTEHLRYIVILIKPTSSVLTSSGSRIRSI